MFLILLLNRYFLLTRWDMSRSSWPNACFWWILLIFAFEFCIRDIAGLPLRCLQRKHDLKKPIPLFREIRPWWIGNAYSIGLSDISNDYPPGNNGFSSKAVLRQMRRKALQLIKGLFYAGLFLFEFSISEMGAISDRQNLPGQIFGFFGLKPGSRFVD